MRMPDGATTDAPETIRARYRLVVFDADDTLRRTLVPGRPCPHAADEWELLPRVREIVDALAAEPGAVRFGIATNQDHVGYGLLDERTARALLRTLAAESGMPRLPEDAIQLCPHPAGAGCTCHKPAPGMLERIADLYGVAPRDTLFVGNADSDRAAAERAGMDFVWAQELFRPDA